MFWGDFSQKKPNSTAGLIISSAIDNFYLHPKSTMILSVVKIMKNRKEGNKVKINIGVESVMAVKVVNMEYNIREGISIRVRKFMV